MSVCAGVDLAPEDSYDEVRALRKVTVHRADAGLLCDLSHRSVYSGGRKHGHSRLKQRVLLALSLRVRILERVRLSVFLELM